MNDNLAHTFHYGKGFAVFNLLSSAHLCLTIYPLTHIHTSIYHHCCLRRWSGLISSVWRRSRLHEKCRQHLNHFHARVCLSSVWSLHVSTASRCNRTGVTKNESTVLAKEKPFRLWFFRCEYEACSLSVGWCVCARTSACTGDMRLPGVTQRHRLSRGSALICWEHIKSICLFVLHWRVQAVQRRRPQRQ